MKILGECCVEWAVKVNVGKCGIAHFRKRRVKRSEEEFRVNGERIDVIAEYKLVTLGWQTDAGGEGKDGS